MSKKSSGSSISDIKEVKIILNGSKDSSVIKDEDEYLTRRELLEKRAENITDTLESLTTQQIERYKFRRIMQIVISVFFMLLVLGLTVALIVCIAYVLKNKDIDYLNAIIVLVGSGVTYLASVITIVAVIVRYTFPENEDKLLTELISKVIEEEQTFFKDEEEQLNYNKKQG